MESIGQHFRDMPLRRAFCTCVLIAVSASVVLSALTVWGCNAFRHWLLPESDKVYLCVNKTHSDGTTESAELLLRVGQELPMLGVDWNSAENTHAELSCTLSKVEQSYHTLTPKRQAAYVAAGAAMVVLPMLYYVAGILICAFWFYRRKLQEPLRILENATEQISRRDLDFSVASDRRDEMGRLCEAFEMMRQGLHQANKEVWLMLEQRQKLLSTVAHDLRNPIAIIKGYTEYLQLNSSRGTLLSEQITMIADNLAFGTARLERYTDSVRHVTRLEAMKLRRATCNMDSFLSALAEDMKILAGMNHKELVIQKKVPELEISIDRENYARILENLFQNSLRFAKQNILLKWDYDNGSLHTTIADDGSGFPDEVLKTGEQPPFAFDPTGEHMGMGLVICRILCNRHGGALELGNAPSGGAEVHFTVNVQ